MTAPSDTELFTVSLTGVGIDIKREVSATKLAQVISVVMKDELPEAMIVDAPEGTEFTTPKRVSLREFLDSSKAKTKPDQIVAIGQYMAVHEGKSTFLRDEIKARFQSARERQPSNFPRDFNVAITKGMIAEDHSKVGQYYITNTGARSVDHRFGPQK